MHYIIFKIQIYKLEKKVTNDEKAIFICYICSCFRRKINDLYKLNKQNV